MNTRKFALLTALGLCLLATHVHASALYVTPEGAGLKDGSSWANAFDSLQNAVNAASNTAAACLIKMQNGVYEMTDEVAVSSLTYALTIRGGYAGTVADTLAGETFL